MFRYATGAAFVDGAGAVLAADAGFRSALGLPDEDITAGLRALAEKDPALRGSIRGDGPQVVRVGGRDGVVILERYPAESGVLLVARSARIQERMEHGLRSAALSRLVAGMAHDIKNPLNAMALQLALLSEKLGPGDTSGPHLAALREQIARVNEVVRRFMDVTDPAALLGYTELGALVADAGALFAHEARRRRIQLVIEPPRGVVRVAGDPVRVGSLVLVLLAGAMAAAPDGGRVEGSVDVEDGQAVFRLAHAMGDEAAETGYDREVMEAAAESLGGSLAERREAGVVRMVLRIPRSERP